MSSRSSEVGVEPKVLAWARESMGLSILPEPPEEPPLPHDFRMLPKDGNKPFSSKTRLAIRRAWRLQSLAVELAESIDREISTKIGRANLSDDPELLASKTREELGIERTKLPELHPGFMTTT